MIPEKLQVPSAATVTVPTTRPSTRISTVAPGSPRPAMSGVGSLVTEPFIGVSMSTNELMTTG